MEKADILENIRKSLETTLIFFTVLLSFVVGVSSHAALLINQNATPSQVSQSKYQLQTSFWKTFFNSYGFVLLIGITVAWVFVGISYLVNSETKTLYSLWCAIIATLVGFAGTIKTLLINANYYPLSFVLLISIAMLIWLVVTVIKIIEATKATVQRKMQNNYK
ncbi:MAG: hypothetical protein RXR32_00310 [Candidatus Micrarchaeota archaeon]